MSAVKGSQVGLFVVFSLVLTASAARGATLYVANNGVDSASCRAQVDPCRTIGRAIANAAAGDTIIVGPGLYGYLYLDGASPGEEDSPLCDSIICVDKALTIESSNGPDVTTIVAEETAQSTVGLLVDGVTFGGSGKGFLLKGSVFNGRGISVPAGTSGNRVIGNILIDASIDLNGSSHEVSQNRLFGTQYGSTTVSVAGNGHVLTRNLLVGPYGMESGFELLGDGYTVTGNVVSGFRAGVRVVGGGNSAVIRGNSFINNSGTGIFLMGGAATVNQNNFFGNGGQPDGMFGLAQQWFNCGILNSSGAPIDATDNFWGVASGPGGDPADDICNESGSIATAPVATQQFAVSTSGGGGNSAPVCAAAVPVLSMLWPANGEFVRTWIIGVGDADNDPVSVSIVGVTQDEPTIGLGTGDTGPDAVLYGSSVDLRAQRAPGGNGRVYRVQFSANDGNGGTCTGAVTVGVPKSQKPGQAIVDDGQNFDSTQPRSHRVSGTD